MNIVVIGAGRVGIRLALQLDEEGHQVSVVDSDQANIDALRQIEEFGGFKDCGIPIDQDVLRNANIENCEALAAVTSNDNINIMVSQLAQEVFDVPKVVARICDPKREGVFSEFKLNTICPTNLSVEAVHAALIEENKPQSVNFATNTISFIVRKIGEEYVGKTTDEYKSKDNEVLYGVLKKNNKLEFYKGEEIKMSKGDKIILSRLVD